jgi:uncharacterized membrane protein YeaQ/YmgE (transglycosylase-associated protein family)
MGILAWIVFGLIAGGIAQLIMPGDDPGGSGFMGWLITMVIGIVGAVVGGLVGAALGFGGVDGFNFGSFVIAVIGALIVLAAWRMLARGSGGGHRFAH